MQAVTGFVFCFALLFSFFVKGLKKLLGEGGKYGKQPKTMGGKEPEALSQRSKKSPKKSKIKKTMAVAI